MTDFKVPILGSESLKLIHNLISDNNGVSDLDKCKQEHRKSARNKPLK